MANATIIVLCGVKFTRMLSFEVLNITIRRFTMMGTHEGIHDFDQDKALDVAGR